MLKKLIIAYFLILRTDLKKLFKLLTLPFIGIFILILKGKKAYKDYLQQ